MKYLFMRSWGPLGRSWSHLGRSISMLSVPDFIHHNSTLFCTFVFIQGVWLEENLTKTLLPKIGVFWKPKSVAEKTAFDGPLKTYRKAVSHRYRSTGRMKSEALRRRSCRMPPQPRQACPGPRLPVPSPGGRARREMSRATS